jgi:hypothetical protein
VAYYDHRHSRIDETNILQVVKAVEGETRTAMENIRRHHFVEPSGEERLYRGLTASYTIEIFLNCSNINYLLRVIYESHFQTFSHI